MMHLTLLGLVQIHWQEGTPPRFRSQRTMALLGYLVAERRVISRDYLAALFWPDEDPATGKANLRRELHNLAQILPDCWQATRVEVEFMHTEGTVVDIYSYQQLEAAGRWQEAADLIGGNFLEGIVLTDNLEFETWLLGEQERWRQRCTAVLSRLLTQKMEKGQYEQAIKDGRQLLQLAPWHEETHRQVMLLLARTGHISMALRQFQECSRILSDELGIEPSWETVTLHEKIKQASTMQRHNLIPDLTPFIGREPEVKLLLDHLFDPNIRLISVVGLGGMGKSRLIVGAARRIENENTHLFLHGIRHVSFASIDFEGKNENDLAVFISQAIGLLLDRPGTAVEQLIDYLKEREMLLLLDNFEHLLPFRDLIVHILRQTNDVKCLISSRTRLGLFQETVLELKGMSFPENNQFEARGVEHQYDAIKLFAASGRRARPSFSISDELQAVINICRLVEGMPLALELAAAWLRAMMCSEIATEIQNNLKLLVTTAPDMPERHRSWRAVFDYSWNLLTESEQIILAKLSLFRGGFTFEAAQAVSTIQRPTLADFVDKSLVRSTVAEQTAVRYQMHELWRQYVAEKLPHYCQEAQQKYVFYFANLLAQFDARNAFSRESLADTLRVIEADHDNIVAAWHQALALHDTPSLTQFESPLHKFYEAQCWYQQAADMFQAGVTHVRSWPNRTSTEDNLWAHLLTRQAVPLLRTSRPGEAKPLAQQAATMLAHQEDQPFYALTLNVLGVIHFIMGEYDEAEQAYNQCANLYRVQENWPELVKPLANLSGIYISRGRYEEAKKILIEGLGLCQQLEDDRGRAHFLTNLGSVYLALKELDTAERYYNQSLPICELLQLHQVKMAIWLNLADIYYQKADYDAAQATCERSLVLARQIGDQRNEARLLETLSATFIQKGALDVAWDTLRQGLAIGQAAQAEPTLLRLLKTAASLHLNQQKPHLAAPLLVFVYHHPKTETHIKQECAQLWHTLDNPEPLSEQSTNWTLGEAIILGAP